MYLKSAHIGYIESEIKIFITNSLMVLCMESFNAARRKFMDNIIIIVYIFFIYDDSLYYMFIEMHTQCN